MLVVIFPRVESTLTFYAFSASVARVWRYRNLFIIILLLLLLLPPVQKCNNARDLMNFQISGHRIALTSIQLITKSVSLLVYC